MEQKINKQSFMDINTTTILKKFNKILKETKETKEIKEIKEIKETKKETINKELKLSFNGNGKYTHIIEYIFAKTDLEQWTYQDIYKLLSATSQTSNCMIDIMMYTKTYSVFIHIDKGKHEIVQISPQSFFNEKTFQNFIKIVKNNQKEKKKEIKINHDLNYDLNSVFVFGGHCNGWKCYTDDYTVDFEMIYNTFIKNNMKFNAICFDCCYTSTFELLYQFHDLTDYIIAHQSYVYGNGFNTRNLSKIFDVNISFIEKLIILCMDYLVRTIDENEFSNFTIIDTYFFKDFLKLFKENYNQILDIIHNKKSKQFLSDVCNKCITSSSISSSISMRYDNQTKYTELSIYNNMLDLYSVIKLFGNKKMIELYNKSVLYRENDIEKDEKYFNKKMKLNGINIIIIPPFSISSQSSQSYHSKLKNKNLDKYYSNLRFSKDFLLK